MQYVTALLIRLAIEIRWRRLGLRACARSLVFALPWRERVGVETGRYTQSHRVAGAPVMVDRAGGEQCIGSKAVAKAEITLTFQGKAPI